MSKETVSQQPHFEEWEARFIHSGKKTTIEKIKLTKSRVLISDRQAHVLNEGLIHGDNRYAHLYYKPGEDQPFLQEIEEVQNIPPAGVQKGYTL